MRYMLFIKHTEDYRGELRPLQTGAPGVGLDVDDPRAPALPRSAP